MIRLFTYKHMNDVICFVVLNKLDDSLCVAAKIFMTVKIKFTYYSYV